MKRLVHLHPLVVAVVPVFYLAAHNVDQVEPGQILVPLALAFILAGLLLGIASALLRDLPKAAIAASILLGLFYSYGRLFEWLWRRRIFSEMSTAHILLALLYCVIAARSLWWVRRTERDLRPAATFIVSVASIMTLFSIGTIAANVVSRPEKTGEQETVTAETTPILEERPDLPDIYYIILDGYLRADLLQELYDFDNSEFILQLEKRGFYIADASWSNYGKTFLSLASSLNMRYLDPEIEDLLKREGSDTRNREPFYALIQRPAAALFLKSKGYRYLTVLTNWGGTERSDIADIAYSYAPVLGGEYYNVLLRSTMLRALAPSVAEQHRFAFERLPDMAQIEGPTFAFVHLLLPHNPYVFDRHGNERANIPLTLHWKEKTGGWRDKKAYIEQMLFLNGKLLTLLDEIIERSSVDPVIILQADHGSATTMYGEGKGSPLPRERLAILNALRVSNEMKSRLAPDMSPVNTFRLLFNSYFDEPLEPLPNRHQFAWYKRPYELKEVTCELPMSEGSPSCRR